MICKQAIKVFFSKIKMTLNQQLFYLFILIHKLLFWYEEMLNIHLI